VSQQPDFVVNEVKDALPDPLEQYLPLTGGNLSGRLEIGSGGLQVAGGLTVLDSGLRVGDTAASSAVAVRGTTSGSQWVAFQRGSSNYWTLGAIGSGSAPEFRVQRYVSGTYVDDPILVSHTTGKVSIQGQPAGRVFSQSTAPASPADGDLWVDTSTPAWTVISSFSNSWAAYGGTTFPQPGYMKDSNGFVHLRGVMKSGTQDTIAFTLPSGYRIVSQTPYLVLAGAGAARLDVYPDGTVKMRAYYTGASNANVHMDGITFAAGF